MVDTKRTVLITGCSDGGMGSTLAMAFDDAGLRVIATARSPSKMNFPNHPRIDKIALDVQSDESIQNCVNQLQSLDILVNNAGAGLLGPVSDISIKEAKELYDLNVWAQLAMTQACLPLLLKSKQAVIVQHSSSELRVLSLRAILLTSSFCRCLHHPCSLSIDIQLLKSSAGYAV